jgi:hypothetical protein
VPPMAAPKAAAAAGPLLHCMAVAVCAHKVRLYVLHFVVCSQGHCVCSSFKKRAGYAVCWCGGVCQAGPQFEQQFSSCTALQ